MITPIDQIAGSQSVTLAQVETACERFEKESSSLDTLITDLETDLEAIKQKHIKSIKRQAGAVASRQADLQSLLERGAGLFTKPRTITVHGVKVGYTTSPGSLQFDDEETVINLIKRYHKQETETYIRTEESVNKDALKLLPAVDLAKLGCRIEGAGDTVVLKRVSGDVEKLINKMITKLVEAISSSEAVS